MRWRTKITAWQPPNAFEDLQLQGPYKLWHHTHRFQAIDRGTLIHDRVRIFTSVWNHRANGAHIFCAREMSKVFSRFANRRSRNVRLRRHASIIGRYFAPLFRCRVQNVRALRLHPLPITHLVAFGIEICSRAHRTACSFTQLVAPGRMLFAPIRIPQILRAVLPTEPAKRCSWEIFPASSQRPAAPLRRLPANCTTCSRWFRPCHRCRLRRHSFWNCCGHCRASEPWAANQKRQSRRLLSRRRQKEVRFPLPESRLPLLDWQQLSGKYPDPAA